MGTLAFLFISLCEASEVKVENNIGIDFQNRGLVLWSG